MTITAGFRVQNGILLCADSMYTGASRIYQPKLFDYEFDVWSSEMTVNCSSIAFALSGNENYAKMAIEDCVEAVRSCARKDRTAKAITRLIRKAVKGINNEYVDTRPESEKENARFELIIGFFSPSSGHLLFKTSGPAVVTIERYCCSGVGAYLGEFIIGNALSADMRLWDFVLVAMNALAAAKSYDANCGGDTQMLVVGKSGFLSREVFYDIRATEECMASFQRACSQMMYRIGACGSSDDFDAEFEHSVNKIREVALLWNKEIRDYALGLIDKLMAEAQNPRILSPPPDRSRPSVSPIRHHFQPKKSRENYRSGFTMPIAAA